MKIVVISTRFLDAYKETFPDDHQKRLENLKGRGVEIFAEPPVGKFELSKENLGGDDSLSFRLFAKGGWKPIKLAPKEKCVVLAHAPSLSEEDTDFPALLYCSRRITTFVFRSVEYSELYGLITRWLIERAILDEEPLKEFFRFVVVKTKIPWRYEYYLELMLRLQDIEEEGNMNAVRKILLGDDNISLGARGRYLESYKSRCLNVTNEPVMFSEIERLTRQYLAGDFKYPHLWEEHDLQRFVDICNLLFQLSTMEKTGFDFDEKAGSIGKSV